MVVQIFPPKLQLTELMIAASDTYPSPISGLSSISHGFVSSKIYIKAR